MDFELYGPFATVEELKRMCGQRSFWPAPIASTTTASTDSWSGQTLSRTLILPKGLQPGFYDAKQLIAAPGANTGAFSSVSSSDSVVVITG